MFSQFINKHADTQLKADLLFFWNRYPNAKFTAGVIAHSVSCNGKEDLEKSLEGFISDDLIEKHEQQGQPFYCLTSNPEKRKQVLKLSTKSKSTPTPRSARGRKERIQQLMLEDALPV